MPYERLLRVNENLIQSFQSGKFIKKDDAEAFVPKEEYAVLHFVRRGNYTVLYDFPVKGDFKRVSPQSIIEGPLEQAPQISERNSFERITDTETRVIPVHKIPDRFTPVELLEYGTALDTQRRWYIDHMFGAQSLSKLPLEELSLIGEQALRNLRERATPRLIEIPTPTIPGTETKLSTYVANVGKTSLELTIGMGNFYRFYPTAYLKVFGEVETTSRWIKELGLDRLNQVFKTKFDQEMGLENSLRKGLAAHPIDASKGFPNIDGDEGIIL